MSILVTGGAGYIGSHTVRLLCQRGLEVIVLDNLAYGHREALDPGVPFFEGELADACLLGKIFAEHDIGAVIHFAAFAYVGESVEQPLAYYRNNLAAPLVLLESMKDHGCRRFVFSSTCATYGEPEEVPIRETEKQKPINPYGRSKWMLEQVLADCDSAWGLKSACLRYFNACGADPAGDIGEDHDPETHLIPLVLDAALGRREAITVFGEDYDTPDGTCIRDYIHVLDLADAHIKALDYLERNNASLACNVGTGQGASVREIIAKARAVTGKDIPARKGGRRPGDPPVLLADPSLARRELGWKPRYTDVSDSIAHAWSWMTGSREGRF